MQKVKIEEIDIIGYIVLIDSHLQKDIREIVLGKDYRKM